MGTAFPSSPSELILRLGIFFSVSPISYPESSGFLVAPLTKQPEDSGYEIAVSLTGGQELLFQHICYVLFAVIFVLGVLNAVVFGMDKETLNRLNWVQMKVQRT